MYHKPRCVNLFASGFVFMDNKWIIFLFLLNKINNEMNHAIKYKSVCTRIVQRKNEFQSKL